MPQVNGSVLRRARLNQGLKKTELARICRTSYSHLDNLENCRRPASLELLFRLSERLGVDVESLAADPSQLDLGVELQKAGHQARDTAA